MNWSQLDIVEGGGVGAVGCAFDAERIAAVEGDAGDGAAGGVVAIGVVGGQGRVGLPGGCGLIVDAECESGGAALQVEILDGDVVAAGGAVEGPFGGAGFD